MNYIRQLKSSSRNNLNLSDDSMKNRTFYHRIFFLFETIRSKGEKVMIKRMERVSKILTDEIIQKDKKRKSRLNFVKTRRKVSDLLKFLR